MKVLAIVASVLSMLTQRNSEVIVSLPDSVHLSKYYTIGISLTNNNNEEVAVEATCLCPNGKNLTPDDGALFYYGGMVILKPYETDTLLLYLSRPMEELPQYLSKDIKGMFGVPEGFLRRKKNWNLDDIHQVRIWTENIGKKGAVRINNVWPKDLMQLPSPEWTENGFFPFIDEFGQYKHKEWKYKVHSASDIIRQRAEEEKELQDNPEPYGWDEYGGFSQGIHLEPTGHFYVTKVDGRWWMVDPLGNLFWSHGLNCVSVRNVTNTKGREKYYITIPPYDDFYLSNLAVKWEGTPGFIEKQKDLVFRRLRSWGINTAAANSDISFYRGHKIPYTIEIRSSIPGYIPDDFDAQAFKESFRNILIERYDIAKSADDSWCIGYFVDNEYGWPDQEHSHLIGEYFKAVNEVLKELAPNKLYLGCRSNSPNFDRRAFEEAAKYCDVISINQYDYNVHNFNGLAGLDKPMIVGEFHFGALDRGLAHTGLRTASNQKQRARLYHHFVEDALKSNYIVGTHWFQYLDQMYTGRSDGENYQIGFVDICDRPHEELIESVREVSRKIYK